MLYSQYRTCLLHLFNELPGSVDYMKYDICKIRKNLYNLIGENNKEDVVFMCKRLLVTLFLLLCTAGAGYCADSDAALLKNNIETLDFIPHGFVKMEMTSSLASEWGGIVGSIDVPSEELFKGRLKLPWLDGNYLIWNTGMGTYPDVHFGAEYDKNKNMVGFIVIQETDTVPANTAIYQYDYKKFDGPLKNMMIFYKDKNKSAYWYSADGKLQGVFRAGTVTAKTQSAAKNINVLKQLVPLIENPKAAAKKQKSS